MTFKSEKVGIVAHLRIVGKVGAQKVEKSGNSKESMTLLKAC